MRVLLIQPPYEHAMTSRLYPDDYNQRARSILPPLGLLSLAAVLKEEHSAYVLDMAILSMGVEGLPDVLSKLRPDIVGVTAVIDLWPPALQVIREVKEYDTGILTVVGGPNATAYPRETLSHWEVDYVIVGNGQKPLMALCDALEDGKLGDGVENCYVRGVQYDKLDCVYSDEYSIGNFPHPDRTFIPTWEYTVPFCPENPSTTMITGMGCPYHCAFCTQRRPPVQLCSVEAVLNEMEEIQALGIRSVLFQDELFTVYNDRVMAICEGLLERGIRLNWTVKSRVDTVQQRTLTYMKDAGCFNIHFGIESGNDDTLRRMRKGYTRAHAINAVKMVKDAGLLCTGNFMLAYPGESGEDILDNIAFARELDLDISQFSITVDTPGAPLFEEAMRVGRRTSDCWRELTEHSDPISSGIAIERWSSSDRFSPEQLKSFLDLAYSSVRTLYDYAY